MDRLYSGLGAGDTAGKNAPRGRSLPFGWCVLVVAAVYAVGLTREINRPWNGLHEWNGALYSLFARNLLRYPWELHHGMPLIAVGEAVPAENERSIYPSHPAGLVWLVAASFRALGESEWSARLVPIAASLGSVVLLMFLVRRRWGDDVAIVCGLVYSIFPMTVYFGRMVNHEPLSLFFMLASMLAWDYWQTPCGPKSGSLCSIVLWAIALAGAAWVDWSGSLFAGLWGLYIVWLALERQISTAQAVTCASVIIVVVAGAVMHVVGVGFGGRWGDLAKIFVSRASSAPDDWPDRAWSITLDNFTLPGLFLGVVGLVWIAFEIVARRKGERPFARFGGFGVLVATGVLWLSLFWRQYQMHPYWAFFLGPFVALGCAAAIHIASGSIPRVHRLAGGALRMLLIAIVAGFGIHGTLRLYDFCSRPSGDFEAWKAVRLSTRTDERILVFPNPLHHEDWGRTRIRFINPPQFPYYVDRPFDSEGNLDRVGMGSGSHRIFLVDMKSIGDGLVRLAALCERFVCDQLGNMVRVDLHQARPATGGASGER